MEETAHFPSISLRKKSCRERRRLESTLPSVSFFAWCFALHQLLLTFCHTNQRVLLAYLRVWKKRRQKCWGLHWLSQKSSTSKHKKERGRENYIITRYCFLFFRGLFLADVTGIVLRLKHVVYTSCIFDTISKQYWSWQCQCNRWPSGPLAQDLFMYRKLLFSVHFPISHCVKSLKKKSHFWNSYFPTM